MFTIIDALNPMKSAYPKKKNLLRVEGSTTMSVVVPSTSQHRANAQNKSQDTVQARNLLEDPGLKGGGMLQA